MYHFLINMNRDLNHFIPFRSSLSSLLLRERLKNERCSFFRILPFRASFFLTISATPSTQAQRSQDRAALEEYVRNLQAVYCEACQELCPEMLAPNAQMQFHISLQRRLVAKIPLPRETVMTLVGEVEWAMVRTICWSRI